MNNLQKMKEVLCNEIMEMSAEEFYWFISETELKEYDFFSMEGVLTCPQCNDLYGNSCSESDTPPCLERFKDYCNKPTDFYN